MRYQQLFLVMDHCGLSSEAFGDKLGVAGMTMRRWRKEPPKDDLPRMYESAFIDAIYRLIVEQKLDPQLPIVREVLAQAPHLAIDAGLANLGLSRDQLLSEADDPEPMIKALRRIGRNEKRQEQVTLAAKSSTLAFFEELGLKWRRRVELLRYVITDQEITLTDKLIAYGALFYLVTPFDLIPDYLPVVGYLDDYAILVMAVGYYVKSFSDKIPSVNTLAVADVGT